MSLRFLLHDKVLSLALKHEGLHRDVDQQNYTYSIQGNNRDSSLAKLFKRKNCTNCLVAAKSTFVFSSIVTTNIQNALKTPEHATQHT